MSAGFQSRNRPPNKAVFLLVLVVVLVLEKAFYAGRETGRALWD
jgi:hypothetical protein